MVRKVEETTKWKVLEACVVTACVCGLGTLVLSEREREREREEKGGRER